VADRSIHQRQRTIVKVTDSIIKFKRDFLDKGSRSSSRSSCATWRGHRMHESTVSRVTTNKYVHTPQGIYELKFFFNSSIARTTAATTSLRGGQEPDPPDRRRSRDKPYSDQKIVESAPFTERRHRAAHRREIQGGARNLAVQQAQAVLLAPAARRFVANALASLSEVLGHSMQVNITFRNMFATDALRNHTQDKLRKVVDKYLDKVTEAHVTLSLERYLHQATSTCTRDISTCAGGQVGGHVRVHRHGDRQIERQLKKHKERLKNHRPAHIHQSGPCACATRSSPPGKTSTASSRGDPHRRVPCQAHERRGSPGADGPAQQRLPRLQPGRRARTST